MTRTVREPHHWLTLGVGLLAALIWASVGVRAIVMDNDPPVKALLACPALVLAGFAFGWVTWIVSAPRRAKRSTADMVMLAEMKATYALSGIMYIGLGGSWVLDASPNPWDWGLMVVASLAGGLNLGVAFMIFADQPASSDTPRQSTGTPQFDG